MMRYQTKPTADGNWDVVDTQTGKRVIQDESYQVASNTAHELNTGATGTDEAADVAEGVLRPRQSSLQRAIRILKVG